MGIQRSRCLLNLSSLSMSPELETERWVERPKFSGLASKNFGSFRGVVVGVFVVVVVVGGAREAVTTNGRTLEDDS